MEDIYRYGIMLSNRKYQFGIYLRRDMPSHMIELALRALIPSGFTSGMTMDTLLKAPGLSSPDISRTLPSANGPSFVLRTSSTNQQRRKVASVRLPISSFAVEALPAASIPLSAIVAEIAPLLTYPNP